MSAGKDGLRADRFLVALVLVWIAASGSAIRPCRADDLTVESKSTSADGQSKSAAASTGPTHIEVWWPLGGAFGQAFEKQVSRFNQSQDRVVVELQVTNGYGGIHRELTQAFRTGRVPDVAIVEIQDVASFAADGRILPLDRFVENDPAFKPADLLPGVLANLRLDDKLYALPMNRSTPVLYYNKDRFAAAGLDPAKPPETWQQVRDLSGALTARDQGQYGFLAVSYAWVFQSLVWSNGGQMVVDGKPSFAEAGAAPLQMWADMVHLDHTARFGKGSGGEFLSGRAAMIINSTALLQSYISQAGFSVGAAMLPHFEGYANAVPTGGGAAVIPASIPAEQQAAAWAFVTWFMDTAQTADWSEMTGYIPVRESAHALLRTEGFYDAHPEFEVAIKQLAFARESPRYSQRDTVWKMIEDSMTSIVRDDVPALKTLKDAEKNVEPFLIP